MRNPKGETLRSLLLGTAAMAVAGSVLVIPTGSAIAQEDESEDAFAEVEQIVVTGSRIRRDAFSSTTPLQVLDVEENRRIGVTSISEILQRSTVSTGQQIDGTFNSNAGNSNATEAPPDGGIGSSNIDLRGLGPERTLILVNGRRLGVAGARGAPAQPDIGLIPLGMVENLEVLTGGASSIYGADAVAGVVNVRLRSDFEGLELSGNVELPEAGGGEVYQSSIIAGIGGDRGNATIGFEYYRQERVRTGNRDFTRCLRLVEETEDGEVIDPCRSGFFDNVIFARGPIPGFLEGDIGPNGQPITGSDAGRVFFTPGETDIGIPNFSTGFGLPAAPDPRVASFPGEDPDANSVFPFLDFYNDQDERRRADLVRPIERFSLVSNGHLDLDWGHNEEVYYEAYYFNRTNNVIAAREQIFPGIAAQIQQEDEDGNVVVDGDGNPILVDNPLNPFPFDAVPILTLEDLPQDFSVEVQQVRLVGGFKGDIGGDWFEENNWTYDTFFSYDRGTGFQSQSILFEPNLDLTLNTLRIDSDGNLVCGLENAASGFGFVTRQECVPVNFFAPSVFQNGEGRLATQEERDFLFGLRTNRTVTKQYNAGAYATGDLFEIPGGDTVATAVGFEWRKDAIGSQNDITGVRGLNAAENPLQEGITVGERWIYDVYGEVTAPLVTDKSFIELLQFDAAVRYTEEENFGSEITYRLGGVYRPLSYLTFSVSRNTSFRAPNLREQFLADQGQGIGGNADPCLANNIEDLPDVPTSQTIINNCELSGADTTELGEDGVVTIPVTVGGSEDLQAEESTSLTAQAQFSQPWFSSFDWDLAVTYFDIEITDTVSELDAGTILARCFADAPNLESPFCSRVSRANSGNRANNFVNLVDASFINIGLETVTGLDVTSRFHTSFDDVGGQPLDLTWVVGASHLLEQNRRIFDESPVVDNAGRIGNPKWTFNSTLALRWDRFEFLWQGRYIGGTAFDEDIENPEEQVAFANNPDLAGDILTRPKFNAGKRFYNDVSFSIDFDQFAISAGVNNLTDQDPPLIASGLIFGPQRNNAVTSSGYDLFGRSFFLNGTVRF